MFKGGEAVPATPGEFGAVEETELSVAVGARAKFSDPTAIDDFGAINAMENFGVEFGGEGVESAALDMGVSARVNAGGVAGGFDPVDVIDGQK